MISSKGILLMAVAGLVGLVAMYTVNYYISAKTTVYAKPQSQVVVAAMDIAPGTIINKEAVKTVSWPQELIPSKALTNLSEVENRIVSIPLDAGEPILLTKLAPEGTSAGLGALLGKGKRALSVRVDDVSGVAGFIHPGDHVDVLVDMQMSESNEHFSKIILQNIMVLTAGQTWQQVRDQKPSVVNTVTLVLTSEQAETLNLASNQGKICLALRNRNDVGSEATSGVATSGLMGLGKKEVAKQRVNGRHVEVIKGLTCSKINF